MVDILLKVSFTRKISPHVRQTESTGNFRVTPIQFRPKMFPRSCIQGIKQYIAIGSPGKTSHSDQARAVSIGATPPEAMRTITRNKEFLFCTQCFVCLFYCLPRWVNCFINNTLLRLRLHTSVCAQRTIASVFPCSGPSQPVYIHL